MLPMNEGNKQGLLYLFHDIRHRFELFQRPGYATVYNWYVLRNEKHITGSQLPFIGFGLKFRVFINTFVNQLLLKMTSNMSLPSIALPGQPLGSLSSYKLGPGTHLPPSALPNPSPSSIIHASILGPTVTTLAKKGLPTLSISRQETVTQRTQTTLLPKEGSIILGRVTRINIREARVQILVINDTPTMEEFTGVIR